MEQNSENLKNNILNELINRVKEERLDFSKIDEAGFRRRLDTYLRSVLKDAKVSFSHQEHDSVLDSAVNYYFGLGPLEKLLNDPDISEIMINGHKEVYVEKKGNIELTDINFNNETHLAYFIEKILSPMGRRVTEFEPFVDTRLNDGSRVNIVKAPVSLIGPVLTIRTAAHRNLDIRDLINLGTLNNEVADFLKACVVSKLNILIAGGASSGKTTLLNSLASFIPQTERVVTIEETTELAITNKHIIPLQTRPSSIEGKGEITVRDLLKNALHMRPDRIIVGEVRSDEVLDMIQAMNTGHDGSMTTLHANSSLEAMDRLEVLVLMGSTNMSSEVAKRQIISAIDLVLHMNRFTDGTRKIVQISEVVKSKEYLLNDIFVLEEHANNSKGLNSTGYVPTFGKKLKERANYSFKDYQG